ncbi:hypothetical protein A2T98_00495 [Nodularia spumigena CENA596]|uniref:Uncharacterized protein n=1 Tax=Nodularia spumigena CENA596 TaxID=1819295 RepID=A0A166L0R6_NODSP|nr:hypothetical protein A2T98_00495 [Nodularia spumigena CENA596]
MTISAVVNLTRQKALLTVNFLTDIAFTNLQKIRIYLCLSVSICGRIILVVPIEVGIATAKVEINLGKF